MNRFDSNNTLQLPENFPSTYSNFSENIAWLFEIKFQKCLAGIIKSTQSLIIYQAESADAEREPTVKSLYWENTPILSLSCWHN